MSFARKDLQLIHGIWGTFSFKKVWKKERSYRQRLVIGAGKIQITWKNYCYIELWPSDWIHTPFVPLCQFHKPHLHCSSAKLWVVISCFVKMWQLPIFINLMTDNFIATMLYRTISHGTCFISPRKLKITSFAITLLFTEFFTNGYTKWPCL